MLPGHLTHLCLATAHPSFFAVCQALLPLPQTAAKAAAAASNKQRAAAEEGIAAAVGDVLHLIGALKELLPLMTGGSLKADLLRAGKISYFEERLNFTVDQADYLLSS